jgi:nucleoporin POM34
MEWWRPCYYIHPYHHEGHEEVRSSSTFPVIMLIATSILGFLSVPSSYPSVGFFLIRALLLLNVVAAFYPLFFKKDQLLDIPLTPSQRALLGLDPTLTPPLQPGSQYITPPRYTSTPRSGRSFSSNYSASPSPLGNNGSPFSPSPSPLLQKAVAGGRRSISGSPLAASGNGKSLMSSFGMPSTPSPTGGKGASVGLNNRWLYERGRGSPGGSKIYS